MKRLNNQLLEVGGVESADRKSSNTGKAGFDFSLNIIIGGAGTEHHLENVRTNADFINETKPNLVFIASLNVDPDSELFDEMKQGDFVENTLRQNLEEEIELLRHLDLDDCYFYGMHTSNVVSVQGKIHAAKDIMLKQLEGALEAIDEELLGSCNLAKGREGKLIIQV